VLTDGFSEISRQRPPTGESLLPHHIDGRRGERLFNPFNIIMITYDEHQAIHNGKSPYTKEDLLERVRKIRIRQGFVQ
jgi:hypothetical protein